MKATTALIAFLALTLFASVVSAETIEQREHVEVVGTAEIKVVPNEFVIRSTLVNFDKSLRKASAANDSAVADVFKRVSKLGVVRKYIVTDQISVNAVTEGYRERGDFRRVGYNVSRDVMVVLHEPQRVEPAMRALFEVGVDRLTVSMGHTDLAQLLEDAQIKATAAAKKAGLLSSSLGRALGPAVSIAEEHAGRHSSPQNFVYGADTPDLGDTISLGKITAQAAVRVKFLLR